MGFINHMDAPMGVEGRNFGKDAPTGLALVRVLVKMALGMCSELLFSRGKEAANIARDEFDSSCIPLW